VIASDTRETFYKIIVWDDKGCVFKKLFADKRELWESETEGKWGIPIHLELKDCCLFRVAKKNVGKMKPVWNFTIARRAMVKPF